MIFNHNGMEKRQNKRRIILLGKHDHAIVMRRKTEEEIDVELYVDYSEYGMEGGGTIIGTIFSNIFRQEFVEMITNQIRATVEYLKSQKAESPEAQIIKEP